MEREDLVGKIVSLCKRRGIIFPTSEIYGNFAGFFDYGNYGSLMKRNVENSLIKDFVTGSDDVVLIDGATITHPLVWKASGHVYSFNMSACFPNKWMSYCSTINQYYVITSSHKILYQRIFDIPLHQRAVVSIVEESSK